MSTGDEIDAARQKLGLPANRFETIGHGPNAVWIVCKCMHCGGVFKSVSADLADVDQICKGDCGCRGRS